MMDEEILAPDGWRIGCDVSKNGDEQALVIISPDGTLSHVGHKWKTTAAHLAFALQGLDEARNEIARLRNKIAATKEPR